MSKLRTLTPALSQKEREDDIRWLNPAIPEEARAVIKRYLKTRIEMRLHP